MLMCFSSRLVTAPQEADSVEELPSDVEDSGSVVVVDSAVAGQQLATSAVDLTTTLGIARLRQ